MALMKCPDCGKDVSTLAPNCPQCGRPLAAFVSKAVQTQRKGGKYEAAGFGLLVLGAVLFFSTLSLQSGGLMAFSGLICAGGFIVFLVGRFM